jgi:hypothetical protein
MDLSCLLNPGACIDGAVASWLAWYPFGIEGVKATVWMVIGAILGPIGVSLVVGLVLALKVSGKTPDIHEQLAGGKDAAPPEPKRKPRKTIFD